MPKSGGAAIPMPLNSKDLIYIVGNAEVIENMPAVKPFAPFAEETVSFLNALSGILLKTGKAYPDVVTFGFWCRKAAVLKEKAGYDDLEYRLGRGVAFHSTPSNVAVNFAFSFAAALLAGNANIVRLPAKDFPQVDIICAGIKELLNGEFKNLAPYVCMVKYGMIKEISDTFSNLCDARIVWGGDMTISLMRQSPLPPRAVEVLFADRHSLLAIDADEYLKAPDKNKIAQNFYNDTFLTDQNACTSPRVVIWLGREKEKAKNEFWTHAHDYAYQKYTIEPVQAVGKLAAFYKAAAALNISAVKTPDTLITRAALNELSPEVTDYKYNSGFFYEYDAENLNEIAPLCGKKCQTLTYYGLNEETLKDFMQTVRPKGVDRIVPIGKSMDFTLVWDGYDLIRELSRIINIVS